MNRTSTYLIKMGTVSEKSIPVIPKANDSQSALWVTRKTVLDFPGQMLHLMVGKAGANQRSYLFLLCHI